MTKIERLVEYIGEHDGDHLFGTYSWTIPDLWYEIKIDGKTGIVSCSCMGSRCHHKTCNLVDLLNGEAVDVCRHTRSLAKAWRRMLEDSIK